jgi:hypothetical protein
MLGVATLFFTWRPHPSGLSALERKSRTQDSLRIAGFAGSIYFIAGLVSILFPGTMGLDPEFGGPGFPQSPLFTSLIATAAAGTILETMV